MKKLKHFSSFEELKSHSTTKQRNGNRPKQSELLEFTKALQKKLINLKS